MNIEQIVHCDLFPILIVLDELEKQSNSEVYSLTLFFNIILQMRILFCVKLVKVILHLKALQSNKLCVVMLHFHISDEYLETKKYWLENVLQTVDPSRSVASYWIFFSSSFFSPRLNTSKTSNQQMTQQTIIFTFFFFFKL